MIVNPFNPADVTDPVWEEVRVHSCDFRPHFDGHLHNLFTTIFPLSTEADTAELFQHAAAEIAYWILLNRKRFGGSDRFQIIVGWPKNIRQTARQVIKTGGDFAAIEKLVVDRSLIQVREGWSDAVFMIQGKA